MTEEDEDDPDSLAFHSSRQISKPQIIEDIGKMVSKVLNSKTISDNNSEAFDRMIESTQDIIPNPHFFLVESGNPNIHIDFSKAKEFIQSIKALIPLRNKVPENANSELYSIPVYGQVQEFEEYKVESLPDDEIISEEHLESEESEQDYLSDSKYISEEFL